MTIFHTTHYRENSSLRVARLYARVYNGSMSISKPNERTNRASSSRNKQGSVRVRSTATGAFVSRGYAKSHPKSTTTERYPSRKTDQVIMEGMDEVIRSTERQISDIDRMAVKYGL